MRSIASMVLKEIENQIEDKVVPVISSIMGSGRDSRLESYENGEESPQYSDSTNERSPVMRSPVMRSPVMRSPVMRNHDLRIPYIQDEKGFI